MKSTLELNQENVEAQTFPAMYIFESSQTNIDKGLVVLFYDEKSGVVVRPDENGDRKIGSHSTYWNPASSGKWKRLDKNSKVILQNT